MQVFELMSRHPVTIAPDQSLAEAATMMQRLDTGFLPVGADDRLIGTLTDRDIALRAVAENKGPETPVSEAMTDDVLYCFEDNEIETAAETMAAQQIRRLPVVDRDKRLVGVVSLGDLAIDTGGEPAVAALEGVARSG